MDLLPTAEQQAMAEAARRLLTDRGYPGASRKLAPGSGIDLELWSTCAELGWLGLGLPETAGGLGLGAADEAVLFRELGRHLAPGPFLATVVAAHAAARLGQDERCQALVSGRLRAALAERFERGSYVIGAARPDLVVSVRSSGILLAAANALGTIERVPSLDPAVVLSRARVALDGSMGDAVDDPDLAARATALSAAVLVGMAEATRDMATDHAKQRVQFGQPIGAFQAVKHRCADMAVRAEAAWAQTCYAAASIDAGAPGAAREAASAKVVAIEAARGNAAANLQVQGGMGFTEEHDAHLYVRRAHVYELAGGARRHHLAVLLER